MNGGKLLQDEEHFCKLADFEEEAKFVSQFNGTTPALKFFDSQLNDIFFGGMARPLSTNIILLFGPTGVGKSNLAVNVGCSALVEGLNVSHMVLEDDMGEIKNRYNQILTQEKIDQIPVKRLNMLPGTLAPTTYEQEDALKQFDFYFEKGYDVVILDHIQFMFEATAKTRDEYVRQRIFIQELNRVAKKWKKTIVLIAHTHKGVLKEGLDLDSVIGSSSIAQVCTKAFGIWIDEGQLYIKMLKSRYTRMYYDKVPVYYDDRRILRYANGIQIPDEEKQRRNRIKNL